MPNIPLQDVPRKVKTQMDNGKPLEGALFAEEAPAEGTDTEEVTAARMSAGEAAAGEARGPYTPPVTPQEKQKKRRNKKKMKKENQSTPPSDG